jgi:hypothetical protein
MPSDVAGLLLGAEPERSGGGGGLKSRSKDI